jgi:hypothetical protein
MCGDRAIIKFGDELALANTCFAGEQNTTTCAILSSAERSI